MAYTYLCNAFSLNMVDESSYNVVVDEIPEEDFEKLKYKFKSVVGHEDTAKRFNVEFNRDSISIKKGDTILVAQLDVKRLPEGTKQLPENPEFKFLLITIK